MVSCLEDPYEDTYQPRLFVATDDDYDFVNEGRLASSTDVEIINKDFNMPGYTTSRVYYFHQIDGETFNVLSNGSSSILTNLTTNPRCEEYTVRDGYDYILRYEELESKYEIYFGYGQQPKIHLDKKLYHTLPGYYKHRAWSWTISGKWTASRPDGLMFVTKNDELVYYDMDAIKNKQGNPTKIITGNVEDFIWDDKEHHPVVLKKGGILDRYEKESMALSVKSISQVCSLARCKNNVVIGGIVNDESAKSTSFYSLVSSDMKELATVITTESKNTNNPPQWLFSMQIKKSSAFLLMGVKVFSTVDLLWSRKNKLGVIKEDFQFTEYKWISCYLQYPNDRFHWLLGAENHLVEIRINSPYIKS